MSLFKDHQVTAKELLDVIPGDLLSTLSASTGVDYYSKVLQGKKIFYLLLHGLLEHDRLSQRTLEDTFNDPVFQLLFDLDGNEKVCHSSISERLSKIKTLFFDQIYKRVFDLFSSLYPVEEVLKYHLVKVDSSMVSEASGKLQEGIDNKSGKKAVKYSVTLDEFLPCNFKVFTGAVHSSEDFALPEVINEHVARETGHENIYVVDRGIQSARNMKEFEQNKVQFIIRAKENRKHVELESLLTGEDSMDLGCLMLEKDSKVYLYTGEPRVSERGKRYYKQKLVEQPFRLIIARDKKNPGKQFCFISNNFELTAKEITDAYRRRWDIEVFFRFIKQELNASHLVSLNRNGIEVMLYMTLIAAMMILIYKKKNNIGYKTAKRRFAMEVRNLVIEMIVLKCGGNPKIFFKT